MEKGIKNKIEITVTKELTALALKSGTLEVFATPAMISLIEETAWRSVAECLEDGLCTVGTALDVKHIAPTPVGMRVWCETELTAIDGRALSFTVNVHDERGLVGSGTHSRFIVDSEKFQNKANNK